jgi:ribonuclease HI
MRAKRAIQVYCDGACKPNPGAMFVGVSCVKPKIAIARKMGLFGTNNEAECLAAITALEECKKRGLTGVELCTDSELLIGWTTGSFKWKAATPFEYVPTIRELLKDVRG